MTPTVRRRPAREGGITDAALRPGIWPLAGLDPTVVERIRELVPESSLESDSGSWSSLESGGTPCLLVNGEDVPDPLPPEVRMVALGVGDRREVLVGGAGGLAELPEGARVGVSSVRHEALLRAHHPGLEPVWAADPGMPVIRPLWPDPSMETQGDVLEWESWLPAPGQGIPVLLHTGAAAGLAPDPAAAVVLAAERRVARRFAGLVVCVRAQVFGNGLRIRALLLSRDARQVVRASAQGDRTDADSVADDLAERLESRGAGRIPASTP